MAVGDWAGEGCDLPAWSIVNADADYIAPADGAFSEFYGAFSTNISPLTGLAEDANANNAVLSGQFFASFLENEDDDDDENDSLVPIVTYAKFTGSMSSDSVTSSGSVTVGTIFARVWLNLLMARARSMI